MRQKINQAISLHDNLLSIVEKCKLTDTPPGLQALRRYQMAGDETKWENNVSVNERFKGVL